MKEIKFRAWDKRKKEMLYTLGGWEDICPLNLSSLFLPFEQYELMQYTGLKDKNGKEIYEGDILKGDYPDEVYWAKQRLQWMLRNRENPDDTLWEIAKNGVEIIGNIYENPELLNN